MQKRAPPPPGSPFSGTCSDRGPSRHAMALACTQSVQGVIVAGARSAPRLKRGMPAHRLGKFKGAPLSSAEGWVRVHMDNGRTGCIGSHIRASW